MNQSRHVLLIALLGALLAAYALRLEQLGTQSFWYDETVTIYLAKQGIGELIAHTARDIHPPLYYLLVHFWVRLVGQSEFAVTYFSLFWGLLLVASSFTLARWLDGRQVALVTVALLTLSPFNIWYSQEARMYTLGATLGLWTLMALWQLLRGSRMKKRWMIFWVASAVAGLYTLYYFAFLLLWEALFVAWWLWRQRATRERWQRWALMGTLLLLLWSPWIPIAIRQATTPPVPPWREAVPPTRMFIETLSALALGQSVDHQLIWPLIALLAPVMLLGLWWRDRQQRHGTTLLFLAGALLLPIAILFLSVFTPSPLYHVRYVFTYSPAFYILLGMAFAGWIREAHRLARLPGALAMGLLLLTPLLVLSGESLQRFWNDSRYAADDLRGGIHELQERWRAGDLLLVNAGYTYTAVNHYLDAPVAWQGRLVQWRAPSEQEGLTVLQSGSVGGAASLGWGLPESDFYATSEEETLASLARATEQAPRLWQLRLYDTVTDPRGTIRAWLEAHAHLFYDQQLTGESNARVQGWYFPPAPASSPSRPISTRFLAPDGSGTAWLTLHGVDAPGDLREGGSWADLTLWLEGSAAMDPSLRFSLGLFDTSPAHRQWAVADEQPLGPLLSLHDLPGVQRWPVRLPLPQGIPPGKYEARLKFYRASDGAVLEGQGERMVNREQVVIAVVEVGPTPPSEVAPKVGTPLEADFGALHLLGHAIPAGPWEPGASIPIELVWRVAEPAQDSLRIFVSSDALSADDGGVAQLYPPSQWQPDGVVRDIHYVTVAPDAAPGDYPLSLRVSQGATTIPWTQGFFRNGELLPIGTLTIRDRPRRFEPPEIATPLDVAFGDSIQLVGATLPQPRYRPGEEVSLTLHWYTVARPPSRYKIFTHLIGPDGNLRAQRDLEPGDGLWPTSGWARGEYVSTSYTILLPPDAPPGQYEVRIGLYDPVTNERVQLFGESVNSESRYLLLGPIEVGGLD